MKQNIFKAIIFDMSGSVISKIAFFLSSILIARSLGSTGLGEYALIFSLIGIINTLIIMGTSGGLIRYFGELRGEQNFFYIIKLIKEVFLLRIVIFSVISIFLVYFSGNIFEIFQLNYDIFIVNYILIYLVLQIPFEILQTYLTTHFQQKFVNALEVFLSFFHILVLYILYFTSLLNVKRLLLVILMILIFKLTIYLKHSKKLLFKNINNNQDTKKDKKYYHDLRIRFFKYSVIMFLISLGGGILAYRSDIYFISYFLGLGAVGYYSLVNNFIDGVFSMVSPKSTSAMYVSSMVEAYKKHGEKIFSKYFQKNVELIFLFTFPIAIGGSILSKNILQLIYGQEYVGAANLFVMTFLIIAILRFAGAISSIFVTLEKPQYFMWTKILSIINIPLNIYLIPKFGINGALFATSLTTSLIIIIEYWLAKHLTNITMPWLNISKIFASSILMGLFIYIIQMITKNLTIFSLILSIIIGALIYVLSIYKLKVIDEDYIDMIVKNKRIHYILSNLFKFVAAK